MASRTPTNGTAPLTVSFNGGGSSDPDPGATLTYAWDLDDDGAFDDATGASDTDAVTITAGNSAPTATIRVNVEGVLVVDGTPTSASRWVEGTATVTVGDGRLTVSNAAGASNDKVNFLDIERPG